MIRKKKKYQRPKKAYEKARIEEENKLVEKYALKNKKEIWKTIAKIKYFRNRAKELAKSVPEEQEVLFGKLRAIGLNTNSIADVLNLKVEDLLERRLPSIVFKKKLANTPKQARQMVVHKKILIGERVTNIPSYFVRVDEENKLSIKKKIKKAKTEEPKQEVQEQAKEIKQGEEK